MAYTTGKTSALQTAIKAAVDIALAEFNAAVAAGAPTPSIMDRVVELRDQLKVDLFEQVDEDNAVVAAQPQSCVPPQDLRGWGRGRKPSGPAPTLEEAKVAVLNFGMFKGMTFESVCAMTSDEVKAYTNGKRDGGGVKYIQWLAGSTKPEQAWARARAKLVLDDWLAIGNTLAIVAGS